MTREKENYNAFLLHFLERLNGCESIENKITEGLDKLGVKKIETIGQKYDPHLHNVIAALHDEGKDDDIILEEYQSGWTMNGKVIRYSKVVVNKKSWKNFNFKYLNFEK